VYAFAMVAGMEALATAKGDLVAARGRGDKAAEAAALLAISESHAATGASEEAARSAAKAEKLFKETGDSSSQAKAALARSGALMLRGSGAETLAAAQEGLALYRTVGDKAGEGSALQQIAVMHITGKKDEPAAKAMSEALTIYRSTGDKVEEAYALLNFAQARLMSGRRAEDAWEQARLALGLFREVGDAKGAAATVAVIVEARIASGSPKEAVREAEAQLRAFRNGGDHEIEALSYHTLVHAHLVVDDSEGAIKASRQAVARLRQLGNWQELARTLHMLASLHFSLSHFGQAIEAAEEALEVVRDKGEGGANSPELNTIIAESHTAKGREPPKSAARDSAAKAIADLGKAFEGRQVQAFDDALNRLNSTGGHTLGDAQAVLGAGMRKDAKGAFSFFKKSSIATKKVAKPAPPRMWQMVSLRTFDAKPAKGNTGGIDWTQTMGRVTLTHPLMGKGWRHSDIKVEVSDQEIKVALKGEVFKALSGQLFQEVHHGCSWWKISEETRGTETNPPQLLVVSLAKKKHNAWLGLWQTMPYEQNRRKAGSHVWTVYQGEVAKWKVEQISKTLKTVSVGDDPHEEKDYLNLGATARMLARRNEKFQCAPDDLCLALEVKEDAKTVTVNIHFDKEALDDWQWAVPVEDLVGVDVWEKGVYAFVKGDELNPIIWVHLTGLCVPAETTWRITQCDSHRQLQKNPSAPSPALQIKLVKAKGHQGAWGKVYTDCYQHRLMVKDESTMERFEGLPDAVTCRRAGYDMEEPDFLDFLDQLEGDILTRTQDLPPAEQLEVARKFMKRVHAGDIDGDELDALSAMI